ncbi:MAG TPA: hypothetical protein VKM72_17595 [Thermoanaerobaculia bacterium]|nr:hypothetical protein [Thermoanaerobaculia bacterium]
MSQLAQEVAPETTQSAVTGSLSMLGTYLVTFNFPQSTTSSRTVSAAIQNPPAGTQTVTIAMQSFDVYYTDNEHYDFGRLAVSISASGTTSASCSVTLRDNNVNEREWEGTVRGLVTFYGI